MVAGFASSLGFHPVPLGYNFNPGFGDFFKKKKKTRKLTKENKKHAFVMNYIAPFVMGRL